MILTQRDIDEFSDAWRRFTRRTEYSPEEWEKVVTDDNGRIGFFFRWLSENPQVVIASGYQEYVAGGRSEAYQTVVSAGDLDPIFRPIFREFTGTWIAPSAISQRPDEPWLGVRLDTLLNLHRVEEERRQNYAATTQAKAGPSLSAYERSVQEGHRLASQAERLSHEANVDMPAFDEMVETASRFVGNPMMDAVSWVSPRIWTPGSQEREKAILQSATSAMIAAVKSETVTLDDLHWRQFEEIVAEVLRNGGMEIHHVRENPQGGRDIIARKEVFPGEHITIAVEVKHRRKVSRPTLQTAIRQNSHFPALMLVTSGRFSGGVIVEAAKPENRLRVFLKDGIAIRDMIAAYRL